ncbi:phage tail tape measure protein [Bordetella avium]|uniref:phage tail tape measure protein n=1 Tax=Bordetella avium TaxID=521 RepID=UPI000E0C251E|nr:phage tail tape measure protein [Bordetella avium]UOK17558.1 tail tape measure [Bordetella phage vB_BaM-IFTN9]RIQ11482.1 phage tail tape measure protein [Bordetella avium]RIQ17449.1 phage tail tape measure protein [Bordetella avium]RIQ42360.1 phage tail tape measure protein [Bordetella avium]RIQ42810.1 phage tail tape measure protein [Bordetella avium]
MADQNIIREFLVSLGWKIDDKGERRFVETVEKSTKRVIALGTAATAAAAAVVAATAKMAAGLEEIYYTSQRTKTSSQNILALGFAAGQAGSSANALRGSLENLARLIRSAPGSENLIQSIGVQTRDANGQLKDTGEVLTDLGERLKAMPYYRAKAYADVLGIDENTLMALQRGLGEFSAEYQAMLKDAGLDAEEASKDSKEFMNQLRLLGATFDILSKKAGTSLLKGLGDIVQRFQRLVRENFQEINEIIVLLGDTAGGFLNLLGRIGTAIGPYVRDAVKYIKEFGEEADKAFGHLDLSDAAAQFKRLGDATQDVWRVIEPIFKKLGMGNLDKFLQSTVDEAGDLAGIGAALLKGDLAGAKAVIDQRKARQAARPAGDGYSPSSKDPRGIRNNNPGNLVYVGQAGASKEANGRFATFSSAQEGLNALAAQLRRYGQRGLNSIQSIVNTYAPASENDTGAYANYLAQKMGIGTSTKFDVNSDPSALAALIRGVVEYENGRNPYSNDMIAQAAGMSTVNLTQNVQISVAGTEDPYATANEVARQQRAIGSDAIRNLRGATR